MSLIRNKKYGLKYEQIDKYEAGMAFGKKIILCCVDNMTTRHLLFKDSINSDFFFDA
jgi:hypothetical protein